MFRNRQDAGQRLGQALSKYKDSNALVLAIPRGGVEVGVEVARSLNAELAIVIARKLPYPDNPEAGFGAIAEDGSTWIHPAAHYWVDSETIRQVVEEQKAEIERRIATLRHGRPLPSIAGRIVILVDDGIAVGSTMRAAIMLCRRQSAGLVVAAAPVAGEDTVNAIGALVDEVVVLEVPFFFQAVAQAYQSWYDVSDREIEDLLTRWEAERERRLYRPAEPEGETKYGKVDQ